MARRRLNQQPEMDSGIVDLLGLAQAGEMLGFNQPPPINELMKLLDVAVSMQGQEQELGLKREQLDLERQKMNRVSPDMITALTPFLFGGQDPGASRRLVEQAAPGVLSSEAPAPTPPPTGDVASGSKLPASRMAAKSQKAFMGYQPPAEDAEAVMDAEGNIINFVQPGTTEQIPGFVPTAGSVGGWNASKIASAQQLEALKSLLGFGPPIAATARY